MRPRTLGLSILGAATLALAAWIILDGDAVKQDSPSSSNDRAGVTYISEAGGEGESRSRAMQPVRTTPFSPSPEDQDESSGDREAGVLDVQVVDTSGHAVSDVPLGFRKSGGELNSTLVWTGVSGDDGRIRVGPFPEREPWVHPLEIVFDYPRAGDAAAGTFDPRHVPGKALRIVKPATGAIEVELVGLDGLAHEGPVRCTVAVANAVTSAASVAADAKPTERFDIDCASGRGISPWIGLGLTLDIDVAARPPLKPLSLSTPGPVAPGETRRIRMQFTDVFTAVTGRVLAQDGSPLTFEKCAVELHEASAIAPVYRWSTIVTDREGQFTHLIPDEGFARSNGKKRFCVLFEPPGTRLEAQAVVDHALRAGTNDLGDLRLAPQPLVVAGVVVDDLGRPLRGAFVHARPAAEGPSEARRRDEDTLRRGGATTDIDGRFKIHAPALPLTVTIAAYRGGFSPSVPATVAAGTRDLRIVLERTGSIAGRARIGGPHTDFIDAAVTDSATRAAIGVGTFWTQVDTTTATFEIGGLRPGSYDVAIRLNGSPAALLVRVEKVLVTAGATTHDRRLLDLDLRETFRTFRLTVRDEAGAPIEEAEVALEGAEGIVRTTHHDGTLDLAVGAQPIDFVVSSEGRQSARVKGFVADRTVTLRAGFRVEIQCSGAEIPADPKQWLGIRVASFDGESKKHLVLTDTRRDEKLGNGVVDAGGQARLTLGFPGPAEVELFAYREVLGQTLAQRVDSPPSPIKVADDPGLQRFALRIDAKAVAAAFAALTH